MKLFKNPQLDEVQQLISRAHTANEEGRLKEALELMQGALERCKRLGVNSAFVVYHLAVAADVAEEFEMAFNYIVQAIAEDPISRPFRHSFDIISGRIRTSLANPARGLDDPSTPRLYDLLVRTGEADVASHLVMARHLGAVGDLARALTLAAAVTTLNPTDRDAWLCRSQLAQKAGQAELATTCAAEAAALEGDPVPFAVPGMAQG
jgi:tetratricopeptide (TPR) repeat protein